MDSAAYRLLIRPLLFSLPPETAQRAAEFVLKRRFLWRSLGPALRVRDNRLPVTLCGLELDNPSVSLPDMTKTASSYPGCRHWDSVTLRSEQLPSPLGRVIPGPGCIVTPKSSH